MNNPLKEPEKKQTVVLCQRSLMSLCGVLNVVSFDENTVTLETSDGILTVEGSELHITRLSLEIGETEIAGHIDALLYSEQRKKEREGFFRRSRSL